jgi:basic membrane lipoprotein Med (substrate-binding protein (PBP1-ABC) superfamily)
MNQLSIVRFVASALAACIAASALVSCAQQYPTAEQIRISDEYVAKRDAEIIEKIKATCTALGFSPGSVAFGQCAMKGQQLAADEQAATNRYWQEQKYLQEQQYQQGLDRMLNRQPSTPVLTCTTHPVWKTTTCQ